MKSIFIEENNAELINRVEKLCADTPALLGKMNAAQMMAHCQASMNIAFGNSNNHRHWVGILFGNFSKNRMLKADKLDWNIPAYIKLRINDERNFGEEKEKFIALIKSVFEKGEAGLVKYPHPYFRKFKPGEWTQLNWKHLDHHLRQFGA